MKKVSAKLPVLTTSAFEKHERFMGQQFKKVFEKLDQHSRILDQHSRILDQHSGALQVILEEARKDREQAKSDRMMMGVLNHTDVAQQRKVAHLELRVEKLEAKVR